jgi:hypothetical protein
MSEETTKNFDGEETFEARVLAEMAALRSIVESRFAALEGQTAAGFVSVNSRLTSVEGRVSAFESKVEALDQKVDARLQDTRPIWESVLSRLKVIDKKFDIHSHDMLELRAEMELIKQRVPPAA